MPISTAESFAMPASDGSKQIKKSTTYPNSGFPSDCRFAGVLPCVDRLLSFFGNAILPTRIRHARP